MLCSTIEYLKALREEKYLLFLEWPQFVGIKYQKGSTAQDADAMVNLLVFEWLNHGFLEKDIEHLALLCAIQEQKFTPLKGSLSYALIAISIAAFQCMVYHNNKVHEVFSTKKTMDETKINELMKASIGLDEQTLQGLLQKEQVSFYKKVSAIEHSIIQTAIDKISAIVHYRLVLDEYIQKMEAGKPQDDSLNLTRLSLAKRLAQYLGEQWEMTEAVRNKITHYVEPIRGMSPSDMEEEYLSALSPMSFLESSWRIGTTVAYSVFNALLPEKEQKEEASELSTSLDKKP